MLSLPENSTISDNGDDIYISHSFNVFYRSPGIGHFQNPYFNKMMEAAPFSHAEYLIQAREALLSCADALEDIHALPKGIYLFGHNHLQFNIWS